MDKAQTGQDLRELWRRWLLPGITLLIFALFALGLRRELAEIHFANVLADLRSIARGALVGAVLCTAASYGLLGFYDVLALRYLGKFVPYGRTLFTSFIAYAFGHNFGIAAFTGGAVRYRLYYSAGLSAADVATVSAFCGVTTAIGLGVLAGVSFIVAPHQGAHAAPSRAAQTVPARTATRLRTGPPAPAAAPRGRRRWCDSCAPRAHPDAARR